MDALSREAVRVLALLGRPVRRVDATVGPEQEYFLVDRAAYARRPDLVLTGRTLLGARPPRGQELDDHYFGALRPAREGVHGRAGRGTLETGHPAKTEHNEVAPCQHELAPVFATVNLATDANQLTMELMKKTAERHGFACLLHESRLRGSTARASTTTGRCAPTTAKTCWTPAAPPRRTCSFCCF